MHNLQSLDIDTSQCGPVLIYTVISKRPKDMKLKILRPMHISRQWDVDEFLAALQKEMKSREMCPFMKYSKKDIEDI